MSPHGPICPGLIWIKIFVTNWFSVTGLYNWHEITSVKSLAVMLLINHVIQAFLCLCDSRWQKSGTQTKTSSLLELTYARSYSIRLNKLCSLYFNFHSIKLGGNLFIGCWESITADRYTQGYIITAGSVRESGGLLVVTLFQIISCRNNILSLWTTEDWCQGGVKRLVIHLSFLIVISEQFCCIIKLFGNSFVQT